MQNPSKSINRNKQGASRRNTAKIACVDDAVMQQQVTVGLTNELLSHLYSSNSVPIDSATLRVAVLSA